MSSLPQNRCASLLLTELCSLHRNFAPKREKKMNNNNNRRQTTKIGKSIFFSHCCRALCIIRVCVLYFSSAVEAAAAIVDDCQSHVNEFRVSSSIIFKSNFRILSVNRLRFAGHFVAFDEENACSENRI